MLAVVLAAGGGTRFHGATHKLLAPLRGRPVLEHAVAHAHAAGLDATIVVSGSAVVTAVTVPEGVSFVHNARWAQGQATSLQTAVAYARKHGHDSIVVGLGDQPFVPAEAWRLVAATEGSLVVAVLEGQRSAAGQDRRRALGRAAGERRRRGPCAAPASARPRRSR